MYQFDYVAWGLGLVGIGIGIVGIFVPFTIKRLPRAISLPSIIVGLGCLLLGIYLLFTYWSEPAGEPVHASTVATLPENQSAAAKLSQQNEEQSVYFEAIRCVYASCSSGACLTPFRNWFPSSALIPSLEAAAANASSSPSCRTAAVSPQQIPPTPKPIRIPDCSTNKSQQKMLPVIKRWLQKQTNETNALTGGSIRVQSVQVLSSRSLFGGQCSVNAIGVLVKGQSQSVRVPIDNLLVDLNYDNNGLLTVQTEDGVR